VSVRIVTLKNEDLNTKIMELSETLESSDFRSGGGNWFAFDNVADSSEDYGIPVPDMPVPDMPVIGNINKITKPLPKIPEVIKKVVENPKVFEELLPKPKRGFIKKMRLYRTGKCAKSITVTFGVLITYDEHKRANFVCGGVGYSANNLKFASNKMWWYDNTMRLHIYYSDRTLLKFQLPEVVKSIHIVQMLDSDWYVVKFRYNYGYYQALLNELSRIAEKINTFKLYDLQSMGDNIYKLQADGKRLVNISGIPLRINDKSALVFKGDVNINKIQKNKKVKKNDLIIKNNTIIWKRMVYQIL